MVIYKWKLWVRWENHRTIAGGFSSHGWFPEDVRAPPWTESPTRLALQLGVFGTLIPFQKKNQYQILKRMDVGKWMLENGCWKVDVGMDIYLSISCCFKLHGSCCLWGWIPMKDGTGCVSYGRVMMVNRHKLDDMRLCKLMRHPSHTSFLWPPAWLALESSRGFSSFKAITVGRHCWLRFATVASIRSTNKSLHAAGDDVQDELCDVCDIAAVDLAFAAIRSDAQLTVRWSKGSAKTLWIPLVI